MTAFFQGLLGVAIPLFAISSMASVGLGHDLREVSLPLRRPAMVASALLANYVLVPLLCLLLLRVFNVPLPQASGLFLVAAAAGAPFLVTLTLAARANVALAGGLLLLLLPATILYMPFVVPLLLPQASVDVLGIARPLVLTMLLPLALGFLVRWRFRLLVPRGVPFLTQMARISLVVLIAATLLANLGEIEPLLASPAIPAAALLICGSLVIGYVMGIPTIDSRVVLSLGTGQRGIAAAMIVANSEFESPEPLVMAVMTSLIGFAVLFPAAWLFRRRLKREARRVRFRLPEAEPGARRQT